MPKSGNKDEREKFYTSAAVLWENTADTSTLAADSFVPFASHIFSHGITTPDSFDLIAALSDSDDKSIDNTSLSWTVSRVKNWTDRMGLRGIDSTAGELKFVCLFADIL
jgi:hypothetical protein